MELTAFRQSLGAALPPEGLDSCYVRSGTKPRAIGSVRTKSRRTKRAPTAAWVHAYLHRKEGDLSNAGYWYRRAGKPVCEDFAR